MHLRDIPDTQLVALWISKILANRLKGLMPKLISEEQTGFVLGRSILDGILTIQETIHSTSKKKEVCMFMKLDIQKAYNF